MILKSLRKLLKHGCLALLVVMLVSLGLVAALRYVNPPSSAVIIAWELENGRDALHKWQALEQISPHLQMAVITSEDQKFPHHFGFDFDSIKSALNESKSKPK